jgi:hypothetical protein
VTVVFKVAKTHPNAPVVSFIDKPLAGSTEAIF